MFTVIILLQHIHRTMFLFNMHTIDTIGALSTPKDPTIKNEHVYVKKSPQI